MKNKIQLLACLITGIALNLNISFSQIDTIKIIDEINKLTSDSLIDAYWIKLDSLDQDLHTFDNPEIQTENLVKQCYFFKKFGFSQYCRFNKSKFSYSNAEMHAQIIWMHNRFVDLSFYTFPLIIESHKIYTQFDYPSYFLQGIRPYRVSSDIEQYNIALQNAEQLSFVNMDIKTVVELANEYLELIKEINKSVKTIGVWKIGKFEAKIYKSKNGNLYLNIMDQMFKIKKINRHTFHFETNFDGSYFEICKNGDLVNKNEKGKIIETYRKE